MAAASNDLDAPSIGEAVERVGFGKAQLLAGFLGGGVYLCGGIFLLLAGALSDSISREWHLRAWERASLMSAIFIGMLLGNSSSGPIGDNYGRRGVIVVSYFCCLASGVLCIFATSFSCLCAWRLALGVSLGLGVPPWMVLSTEITPVAWRVPANAYSQSLFVVGEIYSGLLILYHDSSMKHLEWRPLTALGLLPTAALGVLAYMWLVQSPAYLATKGEHQEAHDILSTMARQNGSARLPSALRQEAAVADNSGGQFQVLFGRRMLYSTLVVIYSCFVLNLVFYGVLYGLPQVVEGIDTGASPAVSLLLGAFWELPGLLAGGVFGTWFRRLPVICGCYAGMAFAMTCFGVGVSMSHMWFSHYMIQGSLLLIKGLSNTAFVVVYQYASEIYPAAARTTGSAICVSGGRLGAIIAPVVFETLADYTGSFAAFFLACALFSALNSCLAMFLPFETAGKSGADDELEPVLAKEKSIVARKLASAC